MRKTLLLFLPFILFTLMACSLPILSLETPVPTDTAVPGVEEENESSVIPSQTATATEVEPVTLPEIEVVISEKQISEEVASPKYLLQVVYPYLEEVPRAALFNQRIEEFIQTEINSFKTNAEENEAWRLENMPELGSDFRIDYEITNQEGNLLSSLFTISFYTAGAAHPGLYVQSFNYDVARGQFIELHELFRPGPAFLELISAYCIDELSESGMMAWEDGAQPVLSNFQDWNIQEDGILISFDPYQVAPGAAGLLQVVVPFDILQDEIQPDGILSPLLE